MYTMPAVIGFLIALAAAFLQNRKVKFTGKMQIAARSMGEENIVTMLLIFLVAGAFSGIVSAAGGVESTVNFGLSIIPQTL
jgi:Na+/H+ antiporter NhaC